nr:hypothetical protein [Tanacetum cinerariifolium]
MIAYLSKSNASKGFNQIFDFLNVNDVIRLQDLVDKKKVVIIEAALRECMSAKRTSWNEFSSSMASAVICLSTEQEIDADEHVKEGTTGADAHGDDSVAQGEVPTITEEPSIPSPTLTIPPPQPPQNIPSTSQVKQTLPQSPQVQIPSPQPQSQPQEAADFPMSLLLEVLNACAALTRRVYHLEYDKVAQALEITKLKRRVKKLEKRNKVRVLKLRRIIAEMDKDDAIILMDDKKEDKKVEEAKVDKSAQVQGRQAESQAEIYKIDMDHANKVLSMHEDETKPAEEQEVVDVVTTAKLITEVVTAVSETVTAAGVVIKDPEEESATSTIIPAETKSKDKDIDWDEAIDHVKLKAKEDSTVKRYQAIKRKPQTKAQARKNMMMYLRNVAGFKLDYFKEMSYDDTRPIFEAKFNSNVDFLLKTKEQLEEEKNRALQTNNETPAEKAAKRRKVIEEVEELKRHL